jgi:hypothetical protein
MMMADMFLCPATTSRVRFVMTAGSIALCAFVYYVFDNPLLAMAAVFLLPECMFRFLLVMLFRL